MDKPKVRVIALPDDAYHKVGKPTLCIWENAPADLVTAIKSSLNEQAMLEKLIEENPRTADIFRRSLRANQEGQHQLFAAVWSMGPAGTTWQPYEVAALAEMIGKQDAQKMIDQTLSVLDGVLHIS